MGPVPFKSLREEWIAVHASIVESHLEANYRRYVCMVRLAGQLEANQGLSGAEEAVGASKSKSRMCMGIAN